MPAIEQRVFSLDAEGASAVLQAADAKEKSARAWQALVEKLSAWERNPDQFEDDGVAPPSPQIIRLATHLAQALEKAGIAVPQTVVPDANGGIVFEHRSGDRSDVYHVWDDGNVEYQCFAGAKLIERRTL